MKRVCVSIFKYIARVYNFSKLMIFFSFSPIFIVPKKKLMNQTLNVNLGNWYSEMVLTCAEESKNMINLYCYRNKNKQFDNYSILQFTWKRLLNTVFVFLSQD